MFRKSWMMVWLIVVYFCGLGYAGENAVISTTDYSSGNLAVLAEGASEAQVDVLPIHSDNAVFSYAGALYVVEKFGKDNIIKVDADDLSPSGVVYQYSVGNGANPQAIAFVSAGRAYVTRYGDTKLWIINPNAASEVNFKIGEIDLSEYADDDGLPEMAPLTLIGGKLYVGIQRLDRNSGWVPLDAKVVVIDTATDAVIKVIALEKGNPQAMAAFGGMLYVSTGGSLFDPTDGAIEQIALSTDEHAGLLVTEADLGGNAGGLAIRSGDKGYVVVGSWPDYVVKPFDPGTGAIGEALPGPSEVSTMAIGPSGSLYVLDRSQETPGVYVYNAKDQLTAGPISTGLPPNTIAFVGEATEVAVEERTQWTPLSFELGANYPNPFNASTVIPYTVENTGVVRLCVYDGLGQHVATLVQEVQAAGRYAARWNGRSDAGAEVASGFYLVRLETAHRSATSKVLFLK